MKKYQVTHQFMNELNKWNDSHKYSDGTTLINQYTLDELPEDVTEWIFEIRENFAEGNRRFGAVINWINGEDVFEVVTLSYAVRLKELFPWYIKIETNGYVNFTSYVQEATKFDDFNKASEWANKHFEVVEVDE